MIVIDNMQAPYGRMIMCHMMADTTEELLDMADKIGVNRKWIQYAGTDKEHFDICLSKRKKAIKYGAKELGWREMVEFMKRGRINIIPSKIIHDETGTYLI